jgi:hypothetical protein
MKEDKTYTIAEIETVARDTLSSGDYHSFMQKLFPPEPVKSFKEKFNEAYNGPISEYPDKASELIQSEISRQIAEFRKEIGK